MFKAIFYFEEIDLSGPSPFRYRETLLPTEEKYFVESCEVANLQTS